MDRSLEAASSLRLGSDNLSSIFQYNFSKLALRVSIPFKDQVSANTVKRQMRDLSSKIGIDVQPIYTSKKLEQDLKPVSYTHLTLPTKLEV